MTPKVVIAFGGLSSCHPRNQPGFALAALECLKQLHVTASAKAVEITQKRTAVHKQTAIMGIV